MKTIHKSEWFEFEYPIEEPEYHKSYNPYQIERVTLKDGTVQWMGLGTNWVKKPGEGWTKLAVDETVLPNENGVYPAERNIFVPCVDPYYEVIYQQSIKNNS